MGRKLTLGLFLALALLFGVRAHAESTSIREGIIAAIEARPSFGPHNITIEASRGAVTLEGAVSSVADKEFVERSAWAQSGVSKVTNLLEVRGDLPRPGDPNLALAVKRAIAADPAIKNYNVNISTLDGVVTLSGEADSAAAKAQMGQAAQRVPGVTNVDNRMNIRPAPTDSELEHRVQEALASDPEVNLRGVQMSVKDGVAIFSGRTGNHRETDRILTIALMVPGVKDVRSSIVESK